MQSARHGAPLRGLFAGSRCWGSTRLHGFDAHEFIVLVELDPEVAVYPVRGDEPLEGRGGKLHRLTSRRARADRAGLAPIIPQHFIRSDVEVENEFRHGADAKLLTSTRCAAGRKLSAKSAPDGVKTR
jgi:hypothetical protein